ncbi:hypothetical protein DWU95_37275, partial [Burkholderia contaminans]
MPMYGTGAVQRLRISQGQQRMRHAVPERQRYACRDPHRSASAPPRAITHRDAPFDTAAMTTIPAGKAIQTGPTKTRTRKADGVAFTPSAFLVRVFVGPVWIAFP